MHSLNGKEESDYHDDSPKKASFAPAWAQIMRDLLPCAEPLIQSAPVQRLRGITFLGILSPRFSGIVKSRLYDHTKRRTCDDGTRFMHSLGVAETFLSLSRRLGLSYKAQCYAVAWGLVHDIATWPLSHTSEPAFAAITGVNSRTLRRMMVLGDSALPESFHLSRPIIEMGLDPEVLLALFPDSTTKFDDDLLVLKRITESPITPDTLEGIWRSGRVFRVDVESPEQLGKCISRDLYDVFVPRNSSRVLLHFWRQKARIYDKFINRPDIVAWESAWALCIMKVFAGVTLVESLGIPEEAIIDGVLLHGLPPRSEVTQLKYKHPLIYYIEPRRKRKLGSDESLEALRAFLKKRKVGDSK
jgi:hypothetical protein